ncbi:MAG: tyrosine-type recombinase/integrase [Bacteroidales bacterium]|jgi:site-specific recombinase XerD|nr:tyrosine-type recombinase/integrase [Bacteroidales bacterium]
MEYLYGKGRKFRRTPLWKHTAMELKNIIQTKSETDSVFSNRLGKPLTRFGIYNIVAKYAKMAARKYPAMLGKRISPHTIRHTTATHLLQAGVDINTIRAWLGHVSINTTNVYAEINLEMKAKALACCEIETNTKSKKWREDKNLMDFLNSL